MNKKVVTVKQIQALDKVAIERLGIPSIVLMENAGRSVAEEIEKRLVRVRNPFVCVVCGIGNNAGDGFVTARYLMNAFLRVKVFVIGGTEDLKADAEVNYRILKKLRCPLRIVNRVDRDFLTDITGADVIVDAIFGVGLNREVLDPFKNFIEVLNSQKKYTVSVDIPSGLDGTTGKIYGVCIKASSTVTFSFAKKGFFQNDGPRYAGRVVIREIGIPTTDH